MAYQRAYFPMKILTLTQGYGNETSTHKYSYALDFCGVDSGKDNVYAPFDCKVTKKYVKSGHSYEVWLTSTKKVLARNGYYGYLTMSITHPSEIASMKVGQKFKQGQLICREGKEGATANHIHLELSEGTKAGWDSKLSKKGIYVNVNRVKPEEYLFLPESSEIKKEEYKGTKYHFAKESEITKHVTSKDGLNVHKTMDFKKKSIIAEFKYKDDVVLLKLKGDYALVYRMGILGWISSKYIK